MREGEILSPSHFLRKKPVDNKFEGKFEAIDNVSRVSGGLPKLNSSILDTSYEDDCEGKQVNVELSTKKSLSTQSDTI